MPHRVIGRFKELQFKEVFAVFGFGPLWLMTLDMATSLSTFQFSDDLVKSAGRFCICSLTVIIIFLLSTEMEQT